MLTNNIVNFETQGPVCQYMCIYHSGSEKYMMDLSFFFQEKKSPFYIKERQRPNEKNWMLFIIVSNLSFSYLLYEIMCLSGPFYILLYQLCVGI